MSRHRLRMLAASIVATVGCAHCDTCDDFPAPCTGPNCGYPYQATLPFDGQGVIEGPIVGAPMSGSIISAPMMPNADETPATGGSSEDNTSPPTAPGPESGSNGDLAPPPVNLDSGQPSPFEPFN